MGYSRLVVSTLTSFCVVAAGSLLAGCSGGSSGSQTTSGSGIAGSSSSADVTSASTAPAGTGDPATVPPSLSFYDGFEYTVDREAADKFTTSAFVTQGGWAYGKDAVLNGPGAGGWLYTTDSIPGFDGTFPGSNSTRVLCVESGAGTYASQITATFRQTDFYLQLGADPSGGSTDTIPADVWIQHWIYIADAGSQRSLFPPTNRLGKWFYPTRGGYPSNDLEWLFSMSGVLINSENVVAGSSEPIGIGTTSLAGYLALTDTDDTIYTDGRPDATTKLGNCGSDPDYQTTIPANAWWLMRLHVDHTTNPGVIEQWIRPLGGQWIKTMDTNASLVVDWNPTQSEGHRAMRFPTTMGNWRQEPSLQTTHGDWWIYLDDFAMARGANAGGNGELDLPTYTD